MKRSNTSENQILVDDDGTPYAFVIAPDYTSEHEWGIKGIRSIFGISGPPGGFSDQTSTIDASRSIAVMEAPMTRYDFESKTRKSSRIKESCLVLTTDGTPEVVARDLLSRHDPQTAFTAAFDEGHFCIGAFSEEARSLLRTIHEGIATKDIAIWMGSSGNPFGRGGLVVARASLVPSALSGHFDEAAAERREIARLAEETGIARRIREGIVDRRYMSTPYFALSPARLSEGRESAHPVMFWLNPTDQVNNAYGWFTVEELDLWIKGEGPVIERSKAAQARRPKDARR